jgi:hypothetical protein
VNQASGEVLLKGKGRIEEVERQRILRTRYSVLLTDGHFPTPLVNFEALLPYYYKNTAPRFTPGGPRQRLTGVKAPHVAFSEEGC